jgi:signal peptidase I
MLYVISPVMIEKKKALRELVGRLLEEGNPIKIPAHGYSMYPAIRPGDALTITPIEDPVTLREGEVVAWKREHDLVVHRLIAVRCHDDRMVLVTRGDSSLVADQPILPLSLAGRVTDIQRKGRREHSFLTAGGRRFSASGQTPPTVIPFIPEWKYRLNYFRIRVIIIFRKIFM